MAPSDERKDLTALARSIDALFAGEPPEAVREEEDGPAAASSPPAPPDPAEAATPASAPPPAETAAAAPPSLPPGPTEPTSAVEEGSGEPIAERDAPPPPATPDPDELGAAIGTYLESDRGGRDRQADGIREMAAALRDAAAVDALADAVERLALAGGASPDEACVAMARELVSPDVGSRLAARLGSERDEQRRGELITVCQRLGDDMAIAVSDALSGTTDRYARRVLMEAMVAMGPAGMNVVERMMEDSRWFVVRNAVAILGEAGGERGVELVTTALAHSDGRVRKEALHALASIGGEDAGMLVYGMIEDADPEVRLAAAMAAGELRVERALKPLLAVLQAEDDEGVIVGVLHALGQLGDPGAVVAIEKRAVGSFFSRPPAAVRIAAYRALHSIGTPHAKALLDKARDDKNPEVRVAVRQIRASS